MAKQIRLLIVDDNAPLAAEISAFMNAQQEIEVVGTAEMQERHWKWSNWYIPTRL